MPIRSILAPLIIVVGGLLAAGSYPARAATFYVDASPTGCGGSPCSNANAGTTEATAFATPQGCVDKMSGGDTCLIKNGVYVGVGHERDPEWDFCERSQLNGSPGQYTTIRNYPGHAPLLCGSPGCDPDVHGTPIGVRKVGGICEYIRFQGLHVVGGFLVFGNRGQKEIRHIVVTGNEFEGASQECDGNQSVVRLESAEFVTFDHNIIHNARITNCSGGVGGQQTSASLLKLYCMSDSTFEYNTLDARNASGLIFPIDEKDTPLRNTHRFNEVFADGGRYFRVTQQAGECGPTEDVSIYGNVFVNTGIQALFYTDDLHILGNTFVGSGGGDNALWVGDSFNNNAPTHLVWRDNLTHGGSWEQNLQVTGMAWDELQSGWLLDHNVYADRDYRQAWWSSNQVLHTSLASWKTATGREAASQEATCTFANPPAGDYRIVAGSCLTASSTGGQIGAFGMTDCVGHTCSASGPSGECGNGVIEPGEICDGSALGGVTCATLGLGGGTLSCAGHCLGYDISGCTGGSGGGGGDGDDCAAAGSSLLVCDGFEDGTLNYWNADLNTDGGNLAVTSTAATGSFAAMQQHPQGGTGGWASRFFADHPQLASPGTPVDDLYLRGYVRFSPGYVWPGISNKMFLVASFESWSAGYAEPLSWAPYYVIIEVDEQGFPTLTLREKLIDAPLWRGMDQNLGQPVAFAGGTWYELQVHLRLNTPGAADGVAEMWIDGVPKLQYNDVNFRETYTQHGWNHLILTPYPNPSAPANQSQYWDQIAVGTTMIGGGTPPVLPPTVDGVTRDDLDPGGQTQTP